jgi:HPt (histidine-containing phosphotransfer) domain-containing protein
VTWARTSAAGFTVGTTGATPLAADGSGTFVALNETCAPGWAAQAATGIDSRGHVAMQRLMNGWPATSSEGKALYCPVTKPTTSGSHSSTTSAAPCAGLALVSGARWHRGGAIVMPMADGTPTAPESESESESVQAYILQRQADLLARAISALTTCPASQLAQELHRLSGTLGAYQLLEARSTVQQFEAVVRSPDVGSPEIEAARTVAIDRLGEIATIPSTDEGESST